MLQAAVKTQPPLFLTSAISVFKTPVCPEKNILQYTCNIKQLDYIKVHTKIQVNLFLDQTVSYPWNSIYLLDSLTCKY